MSYVIAPIEALCDNDLNKTELRVLLAIFSFRDSRTTRPIFPRRESIARRAGLKSADVVSRATAGLVDKGWLTKHGKGGHGRVVVYEAHVPARLDRIDESLLDALSDRPSVSAVAACYTRLLPRNPAPPANLIRGEPSPLAGRIRALSDTQLPTLVHWVGFFEWVGQSLFLTGGGDRGDFVPGLGWLVSDKYLDKIKSGKYHAPNELRKP